MERGCQGDLTSFVDSSCGAEVHRGRSVPTDAGMVMDVVVFVEEPSRKVRASPSVANDFGKSCRHSRVLNWASENGLSLETLGRECDRVTPRKVRSSETSPEVIAVPRNLKLFWRRQHNDAYVNNAAPLLRQASEQN